MAVASAMLVLVSSRTTHAFGPAVAHVRSARHDRTCARIHSATAWVNGSVATAPMRWSSGALRCSGVGRRVSPPTRPPSTAAALLPNLALLLTGPSKIAALLAALAGRNLWKGPAAERER